MSTRRRFIKNSGLIAASAVMPFPGFLIPRNKQKLGVALVGLGYYSTDILAPALQLTEHCELRGIVTGSPEKIPVWQKKYGIKDINVYNYENMSELEDNSEIDVVYIVLPNAMHAKYTEIAANAGKHVWCEKPMATSAEDCKRMIKACKRNKVKLSIGYRMQHEPNTQKIIKWAKEKPFGAIQKVRAEAGFYNGASNRNHWKLHAELGGGAMFDMGVYSLNAARYATGLEPVSVSAVTTTTRPDIFKDVDETTVFNLEFPDGVSAVCKTSFGENMNLLDVQCLSGSYFLKPMQSYSGVQGKTSNGMVLEPFKGNQQARQMDDDSLCIINDLGMLVPGEEGLRDIRIVEAIFKSARQNGKRIPLQSY